MNIKNSRTAALVLGGVAVLLLALLTVSPRRPFLRPGATAQEPTISVFLDDRNERTVMKLEEYLEGVVAAEMGADFPAEAIRAQAIIARTFTLHKIELRGGVRDIHGTDACTSPEHFQAYDKTRVTEAIRNAVRDTRGLIVTQGGRPALVWFHANSGGMTATAEEGLGFREHPTPHVQPVRDPVADPRPWDASIPVSEFAAAVRKAGVQIQGVNSVALGRRGPSGRAMEIRVNGQAVNAPELRLALGPERMRSTLLESISLAGGRVVMRGRGFGHGVGMSQDGARALAQQGRRAPDIINHFYRGVRIEKRWQ